MNKVLTTIGFVGTIIYFSCVYILIEDRIEQIDKIKLNELGDFLAGAFGPLAIFWLILGFFQQGKELQQSTKALKLQAQELNNSVKQQKELVEIAKKQLEADIKVLELEKLKQSAEIKELKYEKQKTFEQAQPNFVFHKINIDHLGDGSITFNSAVMNTGNTVTGVRLSSDIKMKKIDPDVFYSWEKNQDFDVVWQYEDYIPVEEAFWTFHYIDYMGNVGEKKFKLEGSNENQKPEVKVYPVKSTDIQ